MSMAIPNVNFIRCIQPLSSTHQGHVDGLKESLEIYDLTFTLQCVCVEIKIVIDIEQLKTLLPQSSHIVSPPI